MVEECSAPLCAPCFRRLRGYCPCCPSYEVDISYYLTDEEEEEEAEGASEEEEEEEESMKKRYIAGTHARKTQRWRYGVQVSKVRAGCRVGFFIKCNMLIRQYMLYRTPSQERSEEEEEEERPDEPEPEPEPERKRPRIS